MRGKNKAEDDQRDHHAEFTRKRIFFTTLDEYGVPVVVIGKVEGKFQNIYSVDTDNFHDSAILVDSFIKHGRTKLPVCMPRSIITFLSIALRVINPALRSRGIAINPDWVIDGGYTHESALGQPANYSRLTTRPMPFLLLTV